ncbi:MAG: hypothetical protein BM564_01045 [Bacteroidetes bacterium MedPE-SWsnd-G2]|nr:MAG: hypothetical protein BM564_01045 [Bacteroidetes bacterium MedPE-SWsnd-G2]
MNGSYAQFKASQQRNNERRAKNTNKFNSVVESTKRTPTEYNFANPSLVELRKIQQNIQKKKRKEHIRDTIIFWVIMLTIVLIVNQYI